jgi:thioredoxin-related protein
MPYLICNHCDSSYELKNGESPEDFDLECECGGTFEYYANKYEYYKKVRGDDPKIPNSQKPVESIKSSSGGLNNLDRQSKGLIGIGAFCLILLVLIFGTGAFSSLNPSYADVIPANIQTAKAPILVELYAPRCPACRQFDSQVMTNPDVQSKLAGYSVMKINVDTDQERASHFKISVIPTLVLLDAKGKEIRRNEGYMDSNEFLDFLKI